MGLQGLHRSVLGRRVAPGPKNPGTSAGSQVTEGCLLDQDSLAALRELVGDDEDALREVAVAFVEDAPDRFAEIARGLAESDSALIRRAAHTLKGNALTFGALRFADACARLEATASQGAPADARALADEAEVEWASVRPQIEALAA